MQLHQVWQSKHDRASLLASSQPFPTSGRHRRYKPSIHSYIHPLASLKYGLRDPWGLVELRFVLLAVAFPVFPQTHFWMLLAHHQNKQATDTADNNSTTVSKNKTRGGNGKTVNVALTLRSASETAAARALEGPKGMFSFFIYFFFPDRMCFSWRHRFLKSTVKAKLTVRLFFLSFICRDLFGFHRLCAFILLRLPHSRRPLNRVICLAGHNILRWFIGHKAQGCELDESVEQRIKWYWTYSTNLEI